MFTEEEMRRMMDEIRCRVGNALEIAIRDVLADYWLNRHPAPRGKRVKIAKTYETKPYSKEDLEGTIADRNR